MQPHEIAFEPVMFTSLVDIRPSVDIVHPARIVLRYGDRDDAPLAERADGDKRRFRVERPFFLVFNVVRDAVLRIALRALLATDDHVPSRGIVNGDGSHRLRIATAGTPEARHAVRDRMRLDIPRVEHPVMRRRPPEVIREIDSLFVKAIHLQMLHGLLPEGIDRRLGVASSRLVDDESAAGLDISAERTSDLVRIVLGLDLLVDQYPERVELAKTLRPRIRTRPVVEP